MTPTEKLADPTAVLPMVVAFAVEYLNGVMEVEQQEIRSQWEIVRDDLLERASTDRAITVPSEEKYALRPLCPVCLALSTEGTSEPTYVSPWLPIKTAPKDGTRILLSGKNGVSSSEWTTPNGFNPLVTMLAGEAGGYWCETGSAFPVRDPTHWQPLPAPPTSGM